MYFTISLQNFTPFHAKTPLCTKLGGRIWFCINLYMCMDVFFPLILVNGNKSDSLPWIIGVSEICWYFQTTFFYITLHQPFLTNRDKERLCDIFSITYFPPFITYKLGIPLHIEEWLLLNVISEQFFSNIMASRSYLLMKWWRYLFYTRPTN
jgi:hypothetical protein